MTNGQVMTVTGPIATDALGVTDAHDHLFLRSPALAGQEFEDPQRAIDEVRDGKASGLQSIVDLTPIGLGRRPELLREVSTATGVTIVGATGYHRDAHYPDGHWVYAASEELLLDRMLADIEQGMHPRDWVDDAPLDPARAGVIKLGASLDHLSAAEKRRLTAGAAASLATDVPIVVHTEVGTYGDELIDALWNEGVEPFRVALAHVDRIPETELHVNLLERQVYLVYDTIGRTKYHPDDVRVDLIEAAVSAGFGDQIMLGLDLGRRDYFRAYGGGPGLRHLMSSFVPRLHERIGGAAVERIMVGNPARFYSASS